MSSFNNKDKLSDRIDAAIAKKEIKHENKENNQNLLNTFSRVATELLAGLLIGGCIGWTLDKWLDTNPWFLILFFLLGGAAGILNLRRAQEHSTAIHCVRPQSTEPCPLASFPK